MGFSFLHFHFPWSRPLSTDNDNGCSLDEIKMSSKPSCSCSSLRTQLPLPDKNILERNFNQLLGSLDLPNDKITEMNSYDDHKKWEILCSRSLMKVHQSPSFYLQRLKGLFGIRSTQPKTDVAEILRGLEVSLRTYDKDWFQKFLNEKDSLNTLVGLMSSCNLSSENFQILLQCLKVIMMDVDGFEKAINHQTLFDVLIANLPSAAMGNKSTLLQLLTIGCKRENRHEFILKSLRSIVGLEKLMDFLNINKNFESPKVIIAALKLIDAVINAPADMNYRVYLHYEFNKIGLHNQIERLTLNESTLIPEIMAEIKEHKSQVINVNQLIKDHEDIRDTKEKLRRALVKIKEMESQSINYHQQQERHQEVAKKESLEKVSEKNSKVDKFPDVEMKPEILQKSTVVKIAPLIKADTELNVSQQQTVILMKMSPINKPPPPPSMTVKTFSIKKQIQSKCKLPSFNWTPLRPSQISGTIFNGFDDERIMKVVNFTHFEDKFQIGTAVSQCRKSTLANRFHKQPFETLLDPGRLRNVSILLRKLNFTADVVIEAIDDYNFNQLTLDSIELLNNLAPKDSETAAYKSFMNQKKDVVVLSREDKFLMRLSLIERLTRKLAIMSFMGNFDDRVDLLKIQLYNITTAALSLHTSKKLKNIFEIILAFGNYLNSNKSCGPAYGFKLKGTLERLNDTRSNDKKMSLLEYIILEIIANKFPQLLTLDSELFCIDESSRISLKNIQSEANEMTSGWEKVGEESLLTSNCTLVAFKISADEKFNKLMNELEMAKWNYNECATYFGEKSETIDSNEFFSIIQKFIYQFKGLALKVDATTKRTINEGNGNMSTLFP